jgi:predicted CXXCH cytochrome family protein
MSKILEEEPDFLSRYFWRDGTARVSGREYTGMIASKCYKEGSLSCLSCHSMHDYSEPNDQLRAAIDGDRSCLECHSAYEGNVTAHTHHAPDSSGSRCANCHMPHTSYGLFKAIRSHRIDSPDIASSVQSGRPNACNLCHLDKTQLWSAERLGEWYGHPVPEFDADQRSVAASIDWLLRGDAAQRAVTAWHMGWPPALEASGDGWEAGFLALLLTDDYSAVRMVAYRSLRRQARFSNFRYDFLSSRKSRSAAATRALEMWDEHRPSPNDADRSALLLTPDGHLRQREILRLKKHRDTRPIYIAE